MLIGGQNSETFPDVPMLESDKWQYPNGVLPLTVVTSIDAVFLEPRECIVCLDIDDQCAAEHALTVVHFGAAPPDVRLLAGDI
ncbi:hypothetical protein QE397_000104 [Rhodococcus sp. SORGH_AS 301]|nr:hypothetical protein [Rhodococcus sp. SORGH_AS_0301]